MREEGPQAVLLLLFAHTLLGTALSSASTYAFTAYRMQQYNLQQDKRGCRGAIVVAEARSPDEPVLTRRCVVMKLPDFTAQTYQRALRQSAAAVLILMPHNTSVTPQDVTQSFMQAEAEALQKETLMPVYAAPEDQQLLFMYDQLKMEAAARDSSILLQVFRSMVTVTGFQILSGDDTPIQPVTDTPVVTLEGALPGSGVDPPTIVVAAHYDSFGLVPWLSYGADSNGSGVTILLELARLFHLLYSSPRNKAPYHLLFSLTGAGKYNFLGTKRWIEENMDHAESSLLQDNVAFVLCLDTLANGDELYLHVSRPPRPGSLQHTFIQQLEQVVSSRFPWVSLNTVHKKIRLGEASVAWEHEHYSMRRLPGFTLSHVEHPQAPLRGSVLDTLSQVDISKLKRNTVIVAEALARLMYNLSAQVGGSPKELPVFKGQLEISDGHLTALMNFLSSAPRATQLQEQEVLLNSLEQLLRRYLQQVHKHTFLPDRRDPEVTFYDQMKLSVMMYRVKPAAFDLFLGGCIAGYLGVIYFVIQNFGSFYTHLCRAATRTKQQ